MAGVSAPAWIRRAYDKLPVLCLPTSCLLRIRLIATNSVSNMNRSKLLSGLWASDDENCANRSFGVLEQAGFVTTEKGRAVCEPVKLGMHRLVEEAAWIEEYRQHCDARFDELESLSCWTNFLSLWRSNEKAYPEA